MVFPDASVAFALNRPFGFLQNHKRILKNRYPAYHVDTVVVKLLDELSEIGYSPLGRTKRLEKLIFRLKRNFAGVIFDIYDHSVGLGLI